MDLNNKLKGLPHIYYFNLDNRVDRKEYIENQFERWNITNFTRISGTKYLASEWKKWIHLVDGFQSEEHLIDHMKHNKHSPFSSIGTTINHIDFLSFWLKSTNDENLILMEDDYDLSLIEYWHFDWEYLMNNIPYDWDCIQLGYESNIEIKFFLCTKPISGTFFGPCMLNRRYVEHFVNLYYDQQNNIFTIFKNNQFVDLDNSICENGKVYCLPLITINNKLGSGEDNISLEEYYQGNKISRELYYYWWENQRDKITLEQFFKLDGGGKILSVEKILKKMFSRCWWVAGNEFSFPWWELPNMNNNTI